MYSAIKKYQLSKSATVNEGSPMNQKQKSSLASNFLVIYPSGSVLGVVFARGSKGLRQKETAAGVFKTGARYLGGVPVKSAYTEPTAVS